MMTINKHKMKQAIFVIILTGCIRVAGFAQHIDSLMIKISPANAAGTTWKSFDVKIANLSKIPACILHSAYVNLYFDAIVKLSAFREDSVKEMYAM